MRQPATITAVPDITGPAIDRIHRDAAAIFAQEVLPEGMPAPRVTLDLPATDPEPFHVFTWGTAREFGVAGLLSRQVVMITFRVRMTLVASGSTAEDASETANAYLARAVQITLCDTTLGGAVEEVGWPQVVQSESWADQSGRRHAGYLVEFECSKTVAADPAIEDMIGGLE